MDAPFLKDFDAILAAILADYRGQFPDADTSQGSLIFLKSACLASAVWGLCQGQDWVMRQIFPDTATSANLEHHANVRGLTRRSGETDAELLARLLATLRLPPAGGNANDYEQWALSVDGVAAAYCIPVAQGPGTVDVVILASGDTEIPDEDLLDAVYAYIDAVRPVTASVLRVIAPSVIEQAVSMTVSGDDVDTDAVGDEITAYLNSMEPGQDLARSQLFAIAVNNGATDAAITTPAANVSVDPDEMIRAGTINVAAAT